MLRRAIPPIVPTAPNTTSTQRFRALYDAQWNTGSGHDKNATSWQYIGGNASSYYARSPLAITNGIWVDKNYLQFDGTGKAVPTNNSKPIDNEPLELVVLEGLGTVYKKKLGYSPRYLTISETQVKYTHGSQSVYINVPGVDVRMVLICYGVLVVYLKDGQRFHAVNFKASASSESSSYADSIEWFNGFVGKVYSIKTTVKDLSVNEAASAFKALDPEWEYNKNRFKL